MFQCGNKVQQNQQNKRLGNDSMCEMPGACKAFVPANLKGRPKQAQQMNR
jgi:hypothetical protein